MVKWVLFVTTFEPLVVNKNPNSWPNFKSRDTKTQSLSSSTSNDQPFALLRPITNQFQCCVQWPTSFTVGSSRMTNQLHCCVQCLTNWGAIIAVFLDRSYNSSFTHCECLHFKSSIFAACCRKRCMQQNDKFGVSVTGCGYQTSEMYVKWQKPLHLSTYRNRSGL